MITKEIESYKIIFGIVITIITAVLMACSLSIQTIPEWFIYCISLPMACLTLLYVILLNYSIRMLYKLSMSDEVLSNKKIAELIVKELKDRLPLDEMQLNVLKERASRTTNPFLIKKYLKKKDRFENNCLILEVYTDYMYKDEIKAIKKNMEDFLQGKNHKGSEDPNDAS